MIFVSYSNEHIQRERGGKKKKKGIWGITRRIVIMFREACDLECMFVVFVFLCRAEVGGCAVQRGGTGPPWSSEVH